MMEDRNVKEITLEKAIRDLQARIDGEFSIKGVEDCADMKLGVEALKREEAHRQVSKCGLKYLLPGETRGS